MQPPIASPTVRASNAVPRGGTRSEGTKAAAMRAAVRALVRDGAATRGDAGSIAATDGAGLLSTWQGHLSVLTNVNPAAPEATRLARVNYFAQRYLAGRTALVATRETARKGSGAEPLSDLAALALDLDLAADGQRVTELLNAYRELSGDVFPTSLAHHYIALEATSRARQAISSGDASKASPGSRAGRLIRLAEVHLDIARVHLIIIGGEPGTGKSTLAGRMAGASDRALVSSVQVRTDTSGAGASPGLRPDWTSGRQDPARTRAAYEEMLRRSRLFLERGQSVVVDATWSDRSTRARATAVAESAFADLVALRCDSGVALREARIRQRIAAGPAIADAVLGICRRIAADFDPWPEAIVIDTRQPVWDSLSAARRTINARLTSQPVPALEVPTG